MASLLKILYKKISNLLKKKVIDMIQVRVKFALKYSQS